jgi:uncharacterized Zn finger protein
LSAIYPRPKEEFLSVKRESIDVQCPKCNSKDVKKYPVLKPRGWAITTKCQKCFYELNIEYPRPAGPFVPITKDIKFSRIG